MVIEEKVIRHYTTDTHAESILDSARRAAADPDRLTVDDLAPYDELHIGGRSATALFAEKLGLRAGMTVLDIGAGIGGPARYMAVNHDVSVSGVDLSPAFCETATDLSAALGFEGKTRFYQGNGAILPFEDRHYDAACMIHVGMNIADKAQVYTEVFRVLKPGGVFGLYDILAGEGAQTGELVYPLPWARTPETSFLETVSAVTSYLERAGFARQSSEDMRNFAVKMLEKMIANETVMSRTRHPERIRNLLGNIRNGLCGPWVIICRKPE